MTDREKGAGRWISGSSIGSGIAHEGEHDEGCSGLHTTNGFCVILPDRRQRGEKEKARINSAAGAIRTTLKDLSLAGASAAHNGLDPDDRAELLESLNKDLEAFPKKIRPKLREAGEHILDYVAEGNRRDGWNLADSTAISVAPEVPATWTTPAEDDPEELIKDIPRS